MTLQIAQLGQPVLWQPAEPIATSEIEGLQPLIDEMLATLLPTGGVGLAAPQVSVSKRLFLAAVEFSEDPDELPLMEVFINPRIVASSPDKVRSWEGCLSFAELLVQVERSRSVYVEYLNRHGEVCSVALEGLAARVVQHEYDHLDGILTLDRAVSSRHIIKASEVEILKKAEEDA